MSTVNITCTEELLVCVFDLKGNPPSAEVETGTLLCGFDITISPCEDLNPPNAEVKTGTLLCGFGITVSPCVDLEVISFFGISVEVAKGGCLLDVMLTEWGVLYPETGGPGTLL